jgi:hypothetical protein
VPFSVAEEDPIRVAGSVVTVGGLVPALPSAAIPNRIPAAVMVDDNIEAFMANYFRTNRKSDASKKISVQ